ncbi:MAG: SGNH/GDSL hydrolase family protein [Bryobacteraceae bacterium]
MSNLHLCRLALCLAILLCPALAQPNESTEAAHLQRQRQLLLDWASLTRYGSEDSEVRPPKTGENRVVFLGDQVTEGWGAGGEFFPGKPYLNRGIRDQSTAQMLVRFRQDVIELEPKVVVIQAGTNDLGGLTGPVTEGMMIENFMSMAELAKVHGIRVVLASVLPVCDCFKNQTAIRPQGKIISLNGAIKSYAAQSGSVYLDYYSALAAGRNFKKELTSDGLQPNQAGYAAMVSVAEQAIAQALAGK